MPRNSRKQQYVDATLRALLINIYRPDLGYPIETLTKLVWGYTNTQGRIEWETFSGPQFRQEAKYIERRIAAMREEEFSRIREAIFEASKDERPLIALTEIPKPEFLPYALPVTEFYWTYFNCIKRPWTEGVIKSNRQKADGLYSTADLMERVFGLPRSGGFGP